MSDPQRDHQHKSEPDSQPATDEQPAQAPLKLPRGYVQHYGVGVPMTDTLRAKMEAAFGADFSAVRIHDGADTALVHANAYARGSHIYFSPGSYDPHSKVGLSLLGHELAHVIQQAQGRVPVVDGLVTEGALESEADLIGQKVAEGQPFREMLGTKITERAEGPIQRDPQKVPVVAKHVKELLAMSLGELDEYARAQVNWHEHTRGIDKVTYRQLTDALLYARNGDGILSACGWVTVPQLSRMGPANRRALTHYAVAVSQRWPTVHLTRPAASLEEAIRWGDHLSLLELHIAPRVLQRVIDHDAFVELVRRDRCRKFCEYVARAQPTLDAHHGREVWAYLDFCETEDPIDRVGQLRWIKNIHRYLPSTIAKLVENEKTAGANKLPVAVLVHSRFDHNGSFLQDKFLDEAVIDSRHCTLLVECSADLPSLEAVSSELAAIAKEYGKIAQLMFIGHGTSRSIQMTGTVRREDDGEVREQERIDLDENYGETIAMIDVLLEQLDDDAVVLFNACLTDSNLVINTSWTTKDASQMRGHIGKAIRKSASLAQTLRKLAAERKKKNIQVIGSKGSFSKAKLIDKTSGKLTLEGDNDLVLTGSIEQYMLLGMDPEGVMIAALECWLTDENAFHRLLKERIARKEEDWTSTVVRTLFQVVSGGVGTDAPRRILDLTPCAHTLKECLYPTPGTVLHLSHSLPAKYAPQIFDALFRCSERNADAYLALVLAESAILKLPRNHELLLTHLSDPFYTCASLSALKIIDMHWLYQSRNLDVLLAEAPSAATSRGQLLLALLSLVVSKGMSEPGLAFLKTKIVGGKLVDQALVTTLLASMQTPQWIVSLFADQVAEETDEGHCNFNWAGNEQNTIKLKPMTAIAEPKPGATMVSAPGGPTVGIIEAAEVVVIGECVHEGQRWFAVQHGLKKTLFVAFEMLTLTRYQSIQSKLSIGSKQPDANQMQAAAAQGTSGPSGQLPYFELIQRAFGHHDISRILSHIDVNAARAAEAMGAEAFATGEHVAFRQMPSLHTAAHEAAHVVQQRLGMAPNGVGTVGDPYERHADEVADLVVEGKSAAALLGEGAGNTVALQHKLTITGVQKEDPEEMTKHIYDTCKDIDLFKRHITSHGEPAVRSTVLKMITDGTDHGEFDLSKRMSLMMLCNKLRGLLPEKEPQKPATQVELVELQINDIVTDGKFVGKVMGLKPAEAEVQWVRGLAESTLSQTYLTDPPEWVGRATLKKTDAKIRTQKLEPRELLSLGDKAESAEVKRQGSAAKPELPLLPDAQVLKTDLPKSVDKPASESHVVPKDLSFKPVAFHMHALGGGAVSARYIEQMAVAGLQEGFVVVAMVDAEEIVAFKEAVRNQLALSNIVIRPVAKVRHLWAEDSGDFHTDGSIHVPEHLESEDPAKSLEIGRTMRGYYLKAEDKKDTDGVAKVGTLVAHEHAQYDKVSLGQASGTPVYQNCSHIEGGNILPGTTADGRPYALVGKDGVHATRILIGKRTHQRTFDVTESEIKAAIANDYRISTDLIFFIEQAGDFHLDMSMMLLGPMQVIVNDCKEVCSLQAKWIEADHRALRPAESEDQTEWLRLGVEIPNLLEIAKAHAKRLDPYEQRAVKELEAAGLKVLRVAGAFPAIGSLPAMNFLNGEGGVGRDNKPFLVTNGGDPRAEQYIAEQYLKTLGTGFRRLHFIDPLASQESLAAEGGLGCRTKGEGTVVKHQ